MRYTLFLLVILIFSSCEKLLETDNPRDRITAGLVFQNETSLNSAVLNLYNTINFDDNNAIYIGLYVDELTANISNVDILAFTSSNLPSNNLAVYNAWKKMYSAIYQSNLILEGIEASNNLSDSVKNRAKGEAKFCRAISYFHLVNLWGSVPLSKSSEVSQNSQLSKTVEKEIYDLMISDLKESKLLLDGSLSNGEKVRANKWAAAALLSRVYLYSENWELAESEASSIINSGLFTPLPPLSDVFLKNSKESILQLWNQNGFTTLGAAFIPSTATAVPSYVLTDSLFNQFELNDARKTMWIKQSTISGKKYNSPLKYKARTTTAGVSGEYLCLLRAGEQYLIRAEARSHLNNYSTAIDDINLIRARASLTPLGAPNSLQDCLKIVSTERRKELFAENWHRFFDLKRMKNINETMIQIKPSWNSNASRLPIPVDEILRNPKLIQNPGYN